MADIAKVQYSPPWTDTSIIAVAGSSGSGKTSLSMAIVKSLNLPWVMVLSMDSFYKPLTPQQSILAHRSEYDFDAPDAIDFDMLVKKLRDVKAGKKVQIPIYSFELHARLEKTTAIYSPHVLVLEGIFALHDPRVVELLDLKIFADADADKVARDVKERGRDIEGCIKQWFKFVKPNFHRYVGPQREGADIIIPRGIENKVAIGMVTDRIQKILSDRSAIHQQQLRRLGQETENAPLSEKITILPQGRQVTGINTLLHDRSVDREEFIFYFDRLITTMIEKAVESVPLEPDTIHTPANHPYNGMKAAGEVSAIVILRGGSTLETGLKRVIPDCRTGRVLIQTNYRTGEPELHYCKLSEDVAGHARVLLLDPQMASGGAALMAVRVLLDHGVPEERITFVTYCAGRSGLNRLTGVYPAMQVVVCRLVEVGEVQVEGRWVEEKYLGC